MVENSTCVFMMQLSFWFGSCFDRSLESLVKHDSQIHSTESLSKLKVAWLAWLRVFLAMPVGIFFYVCVFVVCCAVFCVVVFCRRLVISCLCVHLFVACFAAFSMMCCCVLQETSRRLLYFTVPRVVAVSPQMRLVEDNPASISLLDIYKTVRNAGWSCADGEQVAGEVVQYLYSGSVFCNRVLNFSRISREFFILLLCFVFVLRLELGEEPTRTSRVESCK